MKKNFILYIILFYLTSILSAGDTESSRRLSGMARALWSPVDLHTKGIVSSTMTKSQIDNSVRQAIVWLEAAQRLDSSNKLILADLEYLYRSEMVDDPGRAIKALTAYSNYQPEDNLCVSNWMHYCLDKLDQQSQREDYINSMLENLQPYPKVQSEMITLLGVYAAQQGQLDRAASLFEFAWKVWPYNLDAGAKLLALPRPEISDTEGQMTDLEKQELSYQFEQQEQFRTVYFLVMSLLADPANVEGALDLADILFDLNKFAGAQLCYGHAVALLTKDSHMVNPNELTGIRFKQAVCAYNIKDYKLAHNILTEILKVSPADIPAAAFAIMAMNKMADSVNALQFTDDFLASPDIQAIAQAPDRQGGLDLAWLYAFALDDNTKAYELIQKAGPDTNDISPPLLAYLQVLSGLITTSEDFLDKYELNTPANMFALAKLYSANGQFEKAYELCQLALNYSPGVLYAKINELVINIREQAGISYSESTDMIDVVVSKLNFQQLSLAIQPELFLQCNSRTARKIYEYGEDILLDVSVVNISSFELPLGPDAFFDPYVYYQAKVTPEIPGVNSQAIIVPLGLSYLSQVPVLRPGFANSYQQVISSGPIGQIINESPQIAFEIVFDCIPAPLINKEGKLISACPTLVSSSEPVERVAFIPTPQRLTLYYKMLQNGKEQEKIQAAILFVGLLKESIASREGKLAYKPRIVDYDKTLNALLANLNDSSWQVRAWTAHSLDGLLNDKKIVNALSALLKDPDWFVRLMALNTLKNSVRIDTVIDWFAQNETDPTIQRQISLWNNTPWSVEPLPFTLPEAKQ
ncbi:MAG: HEAT repeat domain-containing protein [Sedimentisphaerales bacterium]|nr:HEAT repeat domain-containing protein [Sedimentisphaerales bacterium]